MASSVHSFSVKEHDTLSIECIERLRRYAQFHGKSLSSAILDALHYFDKMEVNALWQPKKRK